MQAIITKYLPATNTKGGRIKASCDRGSITLQPREHLSGEAAHREVVDKLIAKFNQEDAAAYGPQSIEPGRGWNAPYMSGQIPSGEFVHVFVHPEPNRAIVQFANDKDKDWFTLYHRKAVEQDGTVGGVFAGAMCSALKAAKVY